ncbi:branched-chain amino acid transporter permease [uncultured Subdoligranulum sp.]|uniref:branched-chain amino acid transporter permease n=1 Tax=uncultured Subdoligranulum sp. TaxID=512298 RepID=UPI002616EA3D|nr:AzlD domain-containing protein [uncultured Subdoligranulum sp.]
MPFDLHAAAQVAVIAAVTLLLRFLPFAVFGGGRPTPRYILYLANVLPCAIMAMLVVYCLRGADLAGPTHGLPELLAAAAVVALHLWRKNTLLSIAGGTALYMVLVQLVFV